MTEPEADGVCVQCLFVVNATMDHKLANPGTIDPDTWNELDRAGIRQFCRVLDPREVLTWYEVLMEKSGGQAKFSLGGMADTLEGFAVYAGTLLCVGHLWRVAHNLSQRVK